MTMGHFTPIHVAIGIIRQGGRLLIARRKAVGDLAGLWEFPGGKCHDDESVEQCLVRELHEELSVTVQLDRALTIVPYRYPHAHVVLHPFLCRILRGEPHPLASQAIRWVTLSELSDFQFPPANDKLFDELRDLDSSGDLFDRST